jgi:hypothetical protein
MLKSKQTAKIENQVYSSRVVRSEFDKNWKTLLSCSGYVIYVATADKAKTEVLLATGERKILIFDKGGKVMVGGGGTSHYSKPHLAKPI